MDIDGKAAAKNDEIPLTRTEFLRILAGATLVQLPKQDLLALMKAAMAPGQVSAVAPDMVFEGPPPRPGQHFQRVAQEQLLESVPTSAINDIARVG